MGYYILLQHKVLTLKKLWIVMYIIIIYHLFENNYYYRFISTNCSFSSSMIKSLFVEVYILVLLYLLFIKTQLLDHV